MVFKRSQKKANESVKSWYHDKYQSVLVQRNVLALLSVGALVLAFLSAFAIMRMAPLKSVEPYLMQIDPVTGVTKKVEPFSRDEYAASPAMDRYFVALYVRAREGYNYSVLGYSQNLVRVLSEAGVFYGYRRGLDPNDRNSVLARLGAKGLRDITVNSISYVQNPGIPVKAQDVTPSKIVQVRFVAREVGPTGGASAERWLATVEFQYASLNLNEEEQLLNPLGFTVLSYQVQREIN